MINMRGPETGAVRPDAVAAGALLHYTHDTALLQKHRGKIEATARLLAMHDDSLKLPPDDRGHGLIAAGANRTLAWRRILHIWWKPYFANSAFAARGLQGPRPRVGEAVDGKLVPAGLAAACRQLLDATLTSIERWTPTI